MHTPTPAQLLQVWERGGEPSAAARALLLLGCSCSDHPPEALAALPLGRRDALLLELRERLFGAEIGSVAHCPRCAAAVEATFRCDDLRLVPADADAAVPVLRLHSPEHRVDVSFRLPDSHDLLLLENCKGPQYARQLLLERCVMAATFEDESGGDPAELPEDLQSEIAQAMAQADPQADLQLALCCPDCGHDWQPPFDIARFLWQELQAWALHMLRDVDTLARAFHWAEHDILNLSPRRRQAYLELCAT